MSKIDYFFFFVDKYVLEKEYEVCFKCGFELVMCNLKLGLFLGCVSYLKCDYICLLVYYDS